MKKLVLATLLSFGSLLVTDDVDTPLKAQYRELQANNCYCNNPAGVSLVNASQLKPSEKKMNEEISQMILDAKNEQYLIRAFGLRGLAQKRMNLHRNERFIQILTTQKKNLDMN